jgi:hypothetical protein
VPNRSGSHYCSIIRAQQTIQVIHSCSSTDKGSFFILSLHCMKRFAFLIVSGYFCSVFAVSLVTSLNFEIFIFTKNHVSLFRKVNLSASDVNNINTTLHHAMYNHRLIVSVVIAAFCIMFSLWIATKRRNDVPTIFVASEG